MSLPDSTASAALSANVINPVYFAFFDFVGDPVRATTAGANVTPSGTSDSDLDGHEFIGIDGDFVDLSPIQQAQGGSRSITATLSGIPGLDDDTIAMLGDPANWRGRNARVWQIIRDAANVQHGGFRSWCTGRMTALSFGGDASGLTITVVIEGYLAALADASNRTYLDQSEFDSGDLSANAAIAIANGNYGGLTGFAATPTVPNGGFAGWGGGLQ